MRVGEVFVVSEGGRTGMSVWEIFGVLEGEENRGEIFGRYLVCQREG